MAGHSKFKNIMYRKGAQDKKRSAMFSKLSREITVAAKMGTGFVEALVGATSPPGTLLLAGALLRAILAIVGNESGPLVIRAPG
jgi:hypothetical protein